LRCGGHAAFLRRGHHRPRRPQRTIANAARPVGAEE
jgi:hypothetical protein